MDDLYPASVPDADPAAKERTARLIALQAASPLRGDAPQDNLADAPLFAATIQPPLL